MKIDGNGSRLRAEWPIFEKIDGDVMHIRRID
jgi:hypothetical protein